MTSVRLNKYDMILLDVLRDSGTPLVLNELQNRFLNRAKGYDEYNKSVGSSIANLYLNGFIKKVVGEKGYYLSAKGQKACRNEIA